MMNKKVFGKDLEEVYRKEKDKERQEELDKKRKSKSEPPKKEDGLEGTVIENGFVFNDVKLVLPDGTSFAEYEQIIIPNESIKNARGEYVRQTWSYWNNDFNTTDELWLNFPLFYHILEWAWKNKNKPKAEKIKESFKEDYFSWLALGTKFNYNQGNDSVVHKINSRGKEISLDSNIPRTERRNKIIRDIQNSNDWKHFLQTLTGKQDITNLADVLEWASGRTSNIGTSKTKQGERPAFASFGSDLFSISCDLIYVGRSRRVYVKK